MSEALVLRRTPFGETSQVVEFMTRERGRVGLMLKGVHRPRAALGGGADLLDHCRITWFARRESRSLAPLRERKLLSHHPGLRSREDLLAAGLVAVELLQALAPEGHSLPRLFDQALAFLRALDARPVAARVPLLVLCLQAGVLRTTGFEPVLDRCTGCDRRPTGHRRLRYDAGAGGLLCSVCREEGADTIEISAQAARRAIELAGADPRALPEDLPGPAVVDELRRLYHRAYTHVLERRPRCLPLPGA